MEPEDKDWKTYKTIANYSLSQKVLGAGTFAKTCLARDTSKTDIYYACKMVNKNHVLGIDEETWKAHKDYFRSRLQAECKIWKELNHPNVVKFQNIVESTSTIYIFLEYCEGGNLERFLIRNSFLSNQEALSLSKQLLDCGNYLASKGIIHRDYKPENILFSNGQLKVSDFGLARILESQDINKEQTLTIAGSPLYMAPEVLQGNKYGLKCDVWSVGIVIYQLFMGNLPFQLTEKERSNTKILKFIHENKLKFPNPLHPQMYQLLIEMLEPDPNDRISMTGAFQKIKNINIEQNQSTLKI